MDPLSLTTTTPFSINQFPLTLFSLPRTLRNTNYGRNPSKFLVLASKDDPRLNQWDQMELKFGKMLGEDPKLTLAKVMGKKLNPDASYMEIEKSFHKKKGKLGDIEEIPLDWAKKGKSSSDASNGLNLVRPAPKKVQSSDSLSGLNLARPVPKKGVKFEVDDKSKTLQIKKPTQSAGMAFEGTKRSVPNVILRKPSVYNEDDEETEKTSKLRIKPNLSLRMGREQANDKFSDMTLLRKPQQMIASTDDVEGESEAEVVVDVELKMRKQQPRDTVSDIPLLKKPEAVSINTNLDEMQRPSCTAEAELVVDVELKTRKEQPRDTVSDITLLQKPEAISINKNLDEIQRPSGTTDAVSKDEVEKNSLRAVSVYEDIVDATTNNYEEFLESDDGSFSTEAELEDDSLIGLQPLKQSNMEFTENESSLTEASDMYVVNSSDKFSMEAALQGKPKRLDQSVKETSKSTRPEKVAGNLESYVNAELENFLATSPLKESEDIDWRRAEDQVKTGGREEVELISCSTRGFVVSCGSLIGFLPYRNLAAKWKFLAFESWLRMKGLDPSTHRQSLGIIGSYDAANKNIPLDSGVNPESDRKSGELSSDMKLEELLSIYDQEKIKFLSSFVGQRIKVNVLIADRKSRKLIFSIRPKEKEELVERKRSLMAKLSIGDIVKCCIKKITYFGIFVEVQGVPALIHQTEVSWDTTLDPASYYKIGQIVEAKVHQLDFALERIFLSLKEITPDPLIEALESVVGDPNSLDERLQAAEPDTEWSDVESLIKELQQIDGIQSVSKGRYFLSPGLAPTFQVYMASMFENQYKLLARAGNQVQEVIVQASLGKEEMKSAILTCTGRVE